jgi:hypothetical protein
VEETMKQSIRMIGGILLAITLSSPAWAGHGHGKGGPGGPSGPTGPGGDGGESQAGGLPALEDRVEADEALIATLQTQVATLMSEVSALQAAVTILQGQNNWAVVNFDGTLARSSSSAGPVTSTLVSTGVYEVTFSKDVSGCAYEATLGGAGAVLLPPGQITVAGDVDGDSNHDVFVSTFDTTGTIATSKGFHLTVTCP